MLLEHVAEGWDWDLYASGNRNDSESTVEDAFSYELTAASASGKWAFALAGDLYKRARNDDGSHESGIGDTTIKATRIWESDDTHGFSLMAFVAIPTGADGITTDRTDEGVRARIWRPLWDWQSKVDLRATHVGGVIPAGTGQFKYDARARIERPFERIGKLGFEILENVREGTRGTAVLGTDLTRKLAGAEWTFLVNKGIASTNRDFYFEVGADFQF